MAISILPDYPAGTRCGNTCSCCKAGRRQLRDLDGTPRVERVVDLHEYIDFEGHLFICESCVREAAAMLGMVDPEMRDEAMAAMHAAQAAADEALAERDEAYQLVELIRGWDGKHPASSVTTGSQPVTTDVVEVVPACSPFHDLKPLPDMDVLGCTRCGWQITGPQVIEFSSGGLNARGRKPRAKAPA